MSRVYMGSQGWGVVTDFAGNVAPSTTVTIKNRADGTNATHYSARTGGTSSTASITTGSDGRIDRWIDEGEYTMTAASVTKDVDAVAGSAGTNSTGWINVTKGPYNATGDGSTNDQTAIQAAIDALPSGGGVIYFPRGDYVVNGTLTIPVGKRVRLKGDGIGATGNFYVTRLKRTSGTATMISAQGTALAAATRVYLEIEDMELSGGTVAGKIILVERASAMKWTRVRIARSTVTGIHLKAIFDSSVTGCIFESMGNGTTDPAVLFDSMTGGDDGAFGGVQRLFISDTFWAGNTGTDLKMTGSTGDASPTNDVEFSNCGFEGGSGSHPYIDLDYAQHCHFSNTKISMPTARSGVMIQQNGSSAGTRSNKFVNTTLDVAGATAPTYLVDVGQGAMQFAGVNVPGLDPTTALFRLRSTLSAKRFSIKGLQYPAMTKPRIADERTVDERIGVGSITFDRVGGAATNTSLGGNQAWSFADAASNDAIMRQEVLPSDCVPGSVLTFAVLWAITSSSGVARWQVGSQDGFVDGDTVSTAATAYTADATAAAVNILKRSAIAGPTVNPGELVQATLTRLGSHANDTLAAAALLVGFEATYPAVI